MDDATLSCARFQPDSPVCDRNYAAGNGRNEQSAPGSAAAGRSRRRCVPGRGGGPAKVSAATLPGEDDAISDELLARHLVRTWSYVSGRSLRDDLPPWLADKEDLIAFWADDFAVPGRHAAPAAAIRETS